MFAHLDLCNVTDQLCMLQVKKPGLNGTFTVVLVRPVELEPLLLACFSVNVH